MMIKLKTTKYWLLIIIITLYSCNRKNTEVKIDKTPINLIEDTIQFEKEYNVDMKENKALLSMYNDKYLLRILPDSTFSKANMAYKIFITLKSDTIINYDMNIDSISNNYYKYREDVIDKIDFKKEYYMSGIETKSNWARAENLYLYAKLNSKKDTSYMRVMLKFKYFGKHQGKLLLNVY